MNPTFNLIGVEFDSFERDIKHIRFVIYSVGEQRRWMSVM